MPVVHATFGQAVTEPLVDVRVGLQRDDCRLGERLLGPPGEPSLVGPQLERQRRLREPAHRVEEALHASTDRVRGPAEVDRLRLSERSPETVSSKVAACVYHAPEIQRHAGTLTRYAAVATNAWGDQTGGPNRT